MLPIDFLLRTVSFFNTTTHVFLSCLISSHFHMLPNIIIVTIICILVITEQVIGGKGEERTFILMFLASGSKLTDRPAHKVSSVGFIFPFPSSWHSLVSLSCCDSISCVSCFFMFYLFALIIHCHQLPEESTWKAHFGDLCFFKKKPFVVIADLSDSRIPGRSHFSLKNFEIVIPLVSSLQSCF